MQYICRQSISSMWQWQHSQCCGFIWGNEEKLSSHSALLNVDSRAPNWLLMPGVPRVFHPTQIIPTELAVSGCLPCVLLPLLLHCRKQVQRDVFISIVIPLSAALSGGFFGILTLKQEIFCAWSVQTLMINTWKGQRREWLQGCSTAGRNAEKRYHTSHPLPTYLQCIFFCVNLPPCE